MEVRKVGKCVSVNHWEAAGMKEQQEADQLSSKESSVTGQIQEAWQLTMSLWQFIVLSVTTIKPKSIFLYFDVQ